MLNQGVLKNFRQELIQEHRKGVVPSSDRRRDHRLQERSRKPRRLLNPEVAPDTVDLRIVAFKHSRGVATAWVLTNEVRMRPKACHPVGVPMTCAGDEFDTLF